MAGSTCRSKRGRGLRRVDGRFGSAAIEPNAVRLDLRVGRIQGPCEAAGHGAPRGRAWCVTVEGAQVGA